MGDLGFNCSRILDARRIFNKIPQSNVELTPQSKSSLLETTSLGIFGMAIGYALFGILVAMAAGVGAAAAGSSALAIILSYSACGAAVLFSAVLTAMIFDRDEEMHKDSVLVAGR